MGVCVWVYTPDWQGPVSFPPVHLSLGHWIPAEIQLPVKAPIGHVRAGHVLECVITDHINDGTHHCPPARHTHTHTHTPPHTHYVLRCMSSPRFSCIRAYIYISSR